MNRRVFLGTLAGGLLVAPLAVEALQAGKVYRVGVIATLTVAEVNSDPTNPLNRGFRAEMRKRGYVEGQNLVLELRSHEGRFERVSKIAAELVRLNVDLIMTTGPEATRQAKQVTTTVPIVMYSRAPVEEGLVANLARPGGNVTGVTNDTGPDLEGKRLGLLRESLVKLRQVAYLGARAEWEGPGAARMRAAASMSGLTLFLAEARPNDYAGAFDLIARKRPDAIIISQSVITTLTDASSSSSRRRTACRACRT